MDEPVLYNPFNPLNNDLGEKLTLRERLCIALSNDDKAAFMSLIKDPGFGDHLGFTIHLVFIYDPLEIARAVLDSDAGDLIDTEDVIKDGMTPLHLAAINCAPKLTKYYLDKAGGIVDAVCDYKALKLKHVTPFDLSAHFIEPNQTHTLFNMLWWLCFHERARIETVRLLVVQSGQHKWARKAFLNYAQNGEIRKLAGLFLAVPELCLPLLRKLNRELYFLGRKKRIVNQQLSLLYDVLDSVGHKLATYIRLKEFPRKSCTDEHIEETMLEVESFIREAATKNYRLYYNLTFHDYYLSFFEAQEQNFFPKRKTNSAKLWNMLIPLLAGMDIFYWLPYMLQKGRGFRWPEIFWLIPTLKNQNPARADNLTRAFEASALYNRLLERVRGRGPGVIVSEIQRDVAGRGNWGTTNDDIAQEVEESLAEVDAEMEATVNKAEEDPIEKDLGKDKRRDAAKREKKSKKFVAKVGIHKRPLTQGVHCL